MSDHSTTRGRPTTSEIRQNILKILNEKNPLYGYEIYHHYINIFNKVHIRSIYYNLNKGVLLKEIKIVKIKEEPGNYSWGSKAEKIYYSLDKNSSAKESSKVKKYFKKNTK